MNTSLRTTTALLCSLGLASLCAQEAARKWDVEIPDPISDGTRPAPTPAPEPIDFTVKNSLTTRMEVTKAPEMSDLPPISGTINVTVQLVEDPQLVDPQPPLPALPPDDPAVVARLAELIERYQGTQLVFLSASVHDHNRTFLRIYPNGKHDGAVTAWSNLDFNHFSGFSTFRVKDGIDGTLHDIALLMGIGNTDSQGLEELAKTSGVEHDAPVIPEMPDLAVGGPTFILVEGDAKSPAMDTLEQIHDLYRNEGARMELAYHAREKAQAERKAYLLANPPKPKDVTIQFWKRNNPSPKGVQALEGGAKP
jgi:hypothetical protein